MNYMLSGKVMIIFWVNKKDIVTKYDVKSVTSVDTSKFAKKSDLVSLKSNVAELDIDKLKALTTNLSKIINAVDNNVIKNSVSDALTAKVNIFDAKVSADELISKT